LFERNKSNLANETYRNHSVAISFVKSFWVNNNDFFSKPDIPCREK
jgi:hypothetical protein